MVFLFISVILLVLNMYLYMSHTNSMLHTVDVYCEVYYCVCTLIFLENEIFLIYKEIQMGSVAKLYMRKGFLIYEEMRKYLTIYEKAISHI